MSRVCTKSLRCGRVARALCVIIGLLTALPALAETPATLKAIRPLRGGSSATPQVLSPDGTLLFGTSRDSSGSTKRVLWHYPFNQLPVLRTSFGAVAGGVPDNFNLKGASAGGRVLVGSVGADPAVWTFDGGVELIDAPGVLLGVSADGKTAFGARFLDLPNGTGCTGNPDHFVPFLVEGLDDSLTLTFELGPFAPMPATALDSLDLYLEQFTSIREPSELFLAPNGYGPQPILLSADGSSVVGELRQGVWSEILLPQNTCSEPPLACEWEILATPTCGWSEDCCVKGEDGACTFSACCRIRDRTQCRNVGDDRQPFIWNGHYTALGAVGVVRKNCGPGHAFDMSATTPHAVSGDGSVIVGAGFTDCSGEGASVEGFNSPLAFRWTEAEGMAVLPLSPLPLPWTASTVSPSGNVVLGHYGANLLGGDVFIWDEKNGARDFEQALIGEFGSTHVESSYRLWNVSHMAVTVDGTSVAIGRGDTPTLNGDDWVATWPCPDIDRDGLCDHWEAMEGVDLDSDGSITPCTPGECPDLELPGADPRRMDIFVEVDQLAVNASSSKPLDTSALSDVVKAFADVPNSLIGNPDSADGINLHLGPVDDADLVLGGGNQYLPPLDPSLCGAGSLPDMAVFQANRFGTAAERNNPAVLAEKRKWFRYLVFGGLPQEGNQGGSGLADPWGNEFVVTLDHFTSGGDKDWQAGTIMHELGHTLGLRHGGAEHRPRYRPNYHSVMNYTWQLPGNKRFQDPFGLARRAFAASWVLDYSRRPFFELDEANLSESLGIGGDPAAWVPAGDLRSCGVSQCSRLVPEGGPVDWNEMDGIELGTANVNVSRIRAGGDDELTTLSSFNDWTFVAENLRSSFSHPNWQHPQPAVRGETCQNFGEASDLEPITSEEIDALLAAGWQMDCNGNGVDDQVEFDSGAADDADGNGVLDVCEPLVGDCDLDDDVDLDDRGVLLAAIGHKDGDPEFVYEADLDRDRQVTFLDYQLWTEAYDAFNAAAAPAAVPSATTSCGLGGESLVCLIGGLTLVRRYRRRTKS